MDIALTKYGDFYSVKNKIKSSSRCKKDILTRLLAVIYVQNILKYIFITV